MIKYGVLSQYLQTLSWKMAWRFYLVLVPFPWDDWQLDDFDMILDVVENPDLFEVLLLRSRRLGKTQTCAYLMVFGMLMGLRIIYITNIMDQLDQPAEYLTESLNPFINTKLSIKFEKHAYGSNGVIFLRSLTENSGRSKTIDWIIYDEEGSMIGKSLLMRNTNKMIANSSCPLILHVGSARAGSPYHDNYARLMADAPAQVLEHKWQDAINCTWFNTKIVEMDRRQALIDGTMWEWEQEYECKWTVPYGLIFKHLSEETWGDAWPREPDRFGIDINREEDVVGIHINPERTECWVLTEDQFDWAADPTELKWLGGVKFEVEDGGYNEKEAITLCRLYGGTKSLWKKADKQARLFLARRMIIHIDPKMTPRIYKDLLMAEYNYLGIYIKDSKHPCHWLEAFLHAIGTAVGETYMETSGLYQQNIMLRNELKRERVYNRISGNYDVNLFQ